MIVNYTDGNISTFTSQSILLLSLSPQRDSAQEIRITVNILQQSIITHNILLVFIGTDEIIDRVRIVFL